MFESPRLILPILLGLSACDREPTTPAGEPVTGQARPLPVSVQVARAVDGYDHTRTYTGEVVARQTTDLGFEVGGRIIALDADVGNSVEKGQVLARIDTRRLVAGQQEVAARLKQAQATLAEMRAGPRTEVIEAARSEVTRFQKEQKLAVLQLGRKRDLLRKNVASQEDVDIAETRLQTVEAQATGAKSRLEELVTGTRTEKIDAQLALVQSLDAQLTRIAIDLDDCELRAPFAGTVSARHFDVGAVVETGRPAFRLVETAHLEAWIGIPPAISDRVAGDQSVTLEIAGHTYTVTAARVLPALDPATRTATVIFDLPAEAVEHGVRPGEIGRLRFKQRVVMAGFWLPIDALTESTRGMWSCYILGKSTDAVHEGSFAVQHAELEVLHVTVDRALVRGTLNDGDRILSGGTQRVVKGQLVVPAF